MGENTPSPSRQGDEEVTESLAIFAPTTSCSGQALCVPSLRSRVRSEAKLEVKKSAGYYCFRDTTAFLPARRCMYMRSKRVAEIGVKKRLQNLWSFVIMSSFIKEVLCEQFRLLF